MTREHAGKHSLKRRKKILGLAQPSTTWRVAAALLFLSAVAASAQLHRATRLGHPSTRFAPPLTEPAELRALLTEPKFRDDVAAILRQAGWTGDVEDLRQAAARAEITEVKLPPGTRLPFMSSRKEGRPVALLDVLWAGNEPIEAYAFEFNSRGRRWRCVTPKPCSNFLVIDLGPEPASVTLTKTAPAEASLCEPIPMSLTVRNTSGRPLAGVRVTETLPAGLRTVGQRTTLDLDTGALAPGAGVQFTYSVLAAAPGAYETTAQAASPEGAQATAVATTMVRAPVLALSCEAPAQLALGRPTTVCLTVTNTGDAAEPKATLQMPIPPGTTLASASHGGQVSEDRVVWEVPDLAPRAGQRVCAELVARAPGALSLGASARGACAATAQVQCQSQVSGVAAILLEVVDLEDPVDVGKEVTYEIQIVNQGSIPGTRIRLTARLPESQEFVSGQGATAVHAQGRVVSLDPLPELAPKAEAKWRVVVKALKPGDARFKVELSSDQFPQPITEEEATQQF